MNGKLTEAMTSQIACQKPKVISFSNTVSPLRRESTNTVDEVTTNINNNNVRRRIRRRRGI
jgi:hypothetical protein